MTDNEKRAHDLAVAIAIDVCRLKMNMQVKNGTSEVVVDYFSEYTKAYESGLATFNEKFPAGK